MMAKTDKSEKKVIKIEWLLHNLNRNSVKGVQIFGKPETVKSKYGKAVAFNGKTDGMIVDEIPLSGLEQFTIEIIMRPDSGGNFEQRFLHFGEVQGDRVLLELRSTPAGWYLDAFIKVGDSEKALIEPGLIHSSDQWYHIAYIFDHGKLETWVNGNRELESHLDVVPVKGGKTSIGMRQNEVSWFKGAIYKIRISSIALKPDKFMEF